MSARQHTNLNADLAHVLEAAAVRPDAFLDDALPHAILDLLVEQLADDVDVLGKSSAEVNDRQSLQLVDALLPGGLVRAEQHTVEAHSEVFVDHLYGLLGI